jgi:hypothetical protein
MYSSSGCYFPTQDGLSHLQLVILHDLMNGERNGEFFQLWFACPAQPRFYVIYIPTVTFFPPLIVKNIYFYTSYLSELVSLSSWDFQQTTSATLIFHLPVIFNYTLWWILQLHNSYSSFSSFFFSAWRIRKASVMFQIICFNLSGTIIYYVHLITFVFFIMSLIVITIVDSNTRKERISNLFRLMLIVSPCILNLIYSFNPGTNRSLPDFTYLLSLSRYIQLLTELFYFSTFNFMQQIVPASLFMIFIVFILLIIQ